jgi:hypothetical protein
MKALVIYESMWGNTELVARAIGEGLAESGEVQVAEVDDPAARVHADTSLLVIGGPTHAFSMSRPSTREDASKQGATQGGQQTGIREWLEALLLEPSVTVATFDTKVEHARRLPGSAGKSAARVARRRGFRLISRSVSFYVRDSSGPLLKGELERAKTWGRELAAALVSSA